jgi:hypothetical protein
MWSPKKKRLPTREPRDTVLVWVSTVRRTA